VARLRERIESVRYSNGRRFTGNGVTNRQK
jgi:hypothetical protein